VAAPAAAHGPARWLLHFRRRPDRDEPAGTRRWRRGQLDHRVVLAQCRRRLRKSALPVCGGPGAYQHWSRPGLALHARSAGVGDSCQAGGRSLRPGFASCHLRAIRGGLWRCLAVTHGHWGHVDLRPLLYRSGTTRMVRMGSPVRFRRGAPHQTSSSGRVQHPAPSMPGGLRSAVCQRFASRSLTVVVRARFEATVLSGLRSCRLRGCALWATVLCLPLGHRESERTLCTALLG
jgi:hypothetical protein